jgi:hypothetical protein
VRFTLWGPRVEDANDSNYGKYRWLLLNKYSSTDWVELKPSAPFYLFIPENKELRNEYESYTKLTNIMPHYGAGILTSRDDFIIDYDDPPLLKRLELFRDENLSDDWIRDNLGIKDNSMWSMKKARQVFRTKPIKNELFIDILYRPYDKRRIYFETNVVFNMRIQIMKHLIKGDNLALVTTRQTKEPWSVLVANSVVAHKATALYDVSSVFPLYLKGDNSELQFDFGNDVNIDKNFLEKFSKNLAKLSKVDISVTPQEFFHYMYAVFHSPTYRSRYAEFLKIDFPRLPLTSNVELFRELCALGKELVAIHLLESPLVNDPGGGSPVYFIGSEPSNSVEKGYPKFENNCVHINLPESFCNVPDDVWEFHVGGYQVCEKWLKDRRGRQLSAEDIAHYQKIVNALGETIRLMGEVDEAIESAGGWPIK